MSFGTYARKVRDHSLPYGRRINALAGCIERYQPVGFLATFGYLEQVAGPLRRDETALLRALDALRSSRDLWLVELSAYAGRRRKAHRSLWLLHHITYATAIPQRHKYDSEV